MCWHRHESSNSLCINTMQFGQYPQWDYDSVSQTTQLNEMLAACADLATWVCLGKGNKETHQRRYKSS